MIVEEFERAEEDRVSEEISKEEERQTGWVREEGDLAAEIRVHGEFGFREEREEEVNKAYDERDELKSKLTLDDLTNFIEQRGLAEKPYNVSIGASVAAFLDVIAVSINAWDGVKEWAKEKKKELVGEGLGLPAGVVEVEKEQVEGFRRLYGFDYVTQLDRIKIKREAGEERGLDGEPIEVNLNKVLIGSPYKNMLVMGSPQLPDGTFYIQHLQAVDGGDQPVDAATVNLSSLAQGHFYIRHFVASIYDYSSSRWPDGWYRMRRDTRVDEVTYVREGRCSHGKGMPLLWATAMGDGNNYSFERVFVLDVFDAAMVREALTNTLYVGKRAWVGETEWENVEERIEEVMAQIREKDVKEGKEQKGENKKGN